MTFELVTEKNIDIAAEIHSISWKESHRTFCSEEFIQAHTKERQKRYIEKEMECGKQFYIINENGAKGIVSVKDNLIENLYVLPMEQGKGYGTELLKYAEHLCKGIPTLWILSNNEKAKNLYRKMGYRFTGNTKTLNSELKELEMQHMLIGKCGFYCGACPTYIANNCNGCMEEHVVGDCFSRDCVIEKGLDFCGQCTNFPCDDIINKSHSTVLDKEWLLWKRNSNTNR